MHIKDYGYSVSLLDFRSFRTENMKNKISIAGICILFAFFWRVQVVCAREFVHPGGLHTRADLNA